MILGEETLVEEQRDYICGKLGIDPDDPGDRLVASSFGVGELGLNLLFESRATITLRRAARRRPEVAQLLGFPEPLGSAPGIFQYDPRRIHLEVVEPDAGGFGELCFTVLDPGASIPLPRYATGDVGCIPGWRETLVAAQSCDVTGPALPIVLLAGRRADRTLDRSPSVEDVKALLYEDPALADLLTGAFSIGRRKDGGARLIAQACTNDTISCEALSATLQQLSSRRWEQMDVVAVPAEAFPDRPLLDFERKLSYLSR
jgi:phenylacetate-CoA ligase